MVSMGELHEDSVDRDTLDGDFTEKLVWKLFGRFMDKTFDIKLTEISMLILPLE